MKYYLTTPLYYVNAKPHIGHAYTTIAADAMARFKRLTGHEVFFLTGTDEHGQKVERASVESGVSPKTFTDRLSTTFEELWKQLNVRYDDFIRTTEPRHIRSVQTVWRQLDAKGLVYRKQYEGWYCTPCEAFWPYREIGHDAGKEKRCPQCGQKLEKIQEENFFFAISKFQDWLISHIRKHPAFIRPETRRNETLSFLERNKLIDLCISRPKARLAWGIACPLSDDHVTYVWFDALINYISACGYPDRKGNLSKFWPCDVHFIGKDILRPHTVYWPIMLRALDLEPPRTVFAHGWWVKDKAKISKTLGNIIDPADVIGEFGIDAFRYFLLREVTFGSDGTYSREAMTRRYNTDLANDLGNLVQRTISMIEKYFDGKLNVQEHRGTRTTLQSAASGLAGGMTEAMDRFQFQEALANVWGLINAANKFIEDSAPWILAKEKKKTDKLEAVLISLCEALRLAAQAIWPFMPETAVRIAERLGLDEKAITAADAFTGIRWNYFSKEIRVKSGPALFPRREK